MSWSLCGSLGAEVGARRWKIGNPLSARPGWDGVAALGKLSGGMLIQSLNHASADLGELPGVDPSELTKDLEPSRRGGGEGIGVI